MNLCRVYCTLLKLNAVGTATNIVLFLALKYFRSATLACIDMEIARSSETYGSTVWKNVAERARNDATMR